MFAFELNSEKENHFHNYVLLRDIFVYKLFSYHNITHIK